MQEHRRPMASGKTRSRAAGGAFVALYRGINVGGNNPVKMESLRAMHESLGHRAVTSYIQSGNVVFSATGTADAVAKKAAVRFATDFGFAAQVLVVAAAEWRELVREN